MTYQVNSFNSTINNVSQMTIDAAKLGYRKVVNWSQAGKNWAIENKGALLTALKIAGMITVLVGLGVFGSGLCSGVLVSWSRVDTWNYLGWSSATHITEFSLGICKKLFQGALIAGSGLVAILASHQMSQTEQKKAV